MMALVTCSTVVEGRKGSSRFARVGAWGGGRGTCLLFLPLGITGDGSQHPAVFIRPCSVLLGGSGPHGSWGKPSRSQGSSWGNPGILGTDLLGPPQASEPQSGPLLSVFSPADEGSPGVLGALQAGSDESDRKTCWDLGRALYTQGVVVK